MAAMRGLKQVMATQSVSAVSLTTAAVTTLTGSLLVAVITCFGAHIGATPITDSKGNTWIQAVGATGTTNGFVAIFYAMNITGGAGHTITFTPTAADFLALTVHEIPGALTSGALSGTNSAVASSTLHPTGNITSVQEEIWVAGCSESTTGTPTVTPANPRLALETSAASGASTEGIVTAVRMVESGITDQISFTTSNRSEGAAIAGFKLIATGGGTTPTTAATFFGG